jgi:hypothetical protein
MRFFLCSWQACKRNQLPQFLSLKGGAHTLRPIGVDHRRSRQDAAAEVGQEEAKSAAEKVID